MINWNLLGIEPTKDISSIKKAYKTKLAETNPEDKPEEFMALREAFEAAMEWAADEDADEEGQTEDLLPEDHPAYGWLQELKSLYANFAKRIDPNSWKALISDPLCTRIDTAADVERTLLVFLMDYWYVPDSVIRTLNEVFRFDENKDRLMEQYPEAFVDAILLTPLQRTLPFEYDLFQVEDGKDYDQFIRLYYNLTGMINQGEFEEASHCLKEIEETGIFHPYINIEKAKLHLSTEQLPAAIKDMEEVSETYRNSPSICCMAGEVELAREDFAKAKEYFLRANQLAPDYKWAKLGLGESTLGQQNYKEAEEWIFQVLSEDRYSPRGKALESQIANAQKEQLIEKMGAENATPEEMLKLAGLHIDNGQSDQAKEVLLHYHSEDLMEESERLHYLGTAELELDNYSASFSYFQQAEALLRQLRSVNADQENIGRIDANTCRTMIMSSLPLEHQGKSKEALEIVTNATIDFPDQPMAFCRKAELHYELKMYQEAIDAATQSIQLDDSFHLPYRIRANAYYELGYYNNAYDDCNDCIALYGGDLQVFLCKINILIEVNEIEGAFAELDDGSLSEILCIHQHGL